MIHLRATGDLLTSVIVMMSFVPSALGVLSMVARPDQPVFIADAGPAFYVTVIVLTLAVSQRWLSHRAAENLSGRATLMLRRFGRIVLLWLGAMLVMLPVSGWHASLALAMLLPPLISIGAINPWSPGASMLLPVFGFAGVFVLAPNSALGLPIDNVRVEIAWGFGLIMVLVMGAGWGRMRRAGGPPTPSCAGGYPNHSRRS